MRSRPDPWRSRAIAPSLLNRAGWSAIALLLALATSAPSRALAEPDDPAAPTGNLLASARLVDSLDIAGSARLAVDDAGVVEGARSVGSHGIRFVSAAGSLTYDLGVESPIATAFVQADAFNTFSLQVSDDGKVFRDVWVVPMAASEGRGVRSRSTFLSGVRGRFVRFGEATGPGARAVAELQLFAEIPADWPGTLRVAKAEPRPPEARRVSRLLTLRNSNMAKMWIAFLGAALLAWGFVLNRRGRPDRFSRIRDGLLLALGILGYAGYYNWGAYHFPGRIHQHEFFHYFIGAKYFPELGYTHLYECANVAEAEQGFRRRVELRAIRDLRKNEIVSAAYVLEDPESFKRGFIRPFTPQRWEDFKADIAYFRDRAGVEWWEKMLRDHGYNPSPVWNMTGTLLANLRPASDPFIAGVLGWIDPVLLLVAFGLITWTFGWRVASVAAIFFGTNEPGLYWWTGGGFIRQDWFLAAVAGLCFLKRGKPALGGACLAVSTLLRVFPVGFFVAIGLRLAWILVRERRIDRVGGSIVAGAAIVTVILLPLSSVVTGSASAWPEFLKNTKKHADSPMSNLMGLRTIVGFRWETRQKVMVVSGVTDPFHNFREARKSTLRGAMGQPLFLALVVAYLALLVWGVRREMEWWVLAAFGFGVIAVSMELTCYYFSFLAVAAFLREKHEVIPIGLLLLAGLSHFIEISTFYFDLRYLVESVAVVAFVVWATWSYGRRPAVVSPT